MDDEDVVALTLLCLLKKKRRKEKRLWTYKYFARRKEKSVFYNLVRELSIESPDRLRQWMRLNLTQYQELLELVTPMIVKKDTCMPEAVSAGERLTLTLRYLATGETYTSLSAQFRISHNLISRIVPEVCQAIYRVLQPTYMKLPTTEQEWHKVASDFFNQWNFPMCIGALDGKRILICKPAHSGSDYYDYKGHFSVILLALVDADCKFLYVDVGARGRASDGGVWDACSLQKLIENKRLNIPLEQNLPFSNLECPFVIVGDDAFPLKNYLMKPYPGREQTHDRRIFNYRLSRARRTSENAFGILAARFQVFKSPIKTSRKNVQAITLACLVLHNYLRVTSKDSYSPPELCDTEDKNTGKLQPGRWRDYPHGAFENLQGVGGGQANNAKVVRENLREYFVTGGRLHYQDNYVLQH